MGPKKSPPGDQRPQEDIRRSKVASAVELADQALAALLSNRPRTEVKRLLKRLVEELRGGR